MGRTYRKGFMTDRDDRIKIRPKKQKKPKPLLDKYTELELLRELNDGYEPTVYEEMDRD